MKLYLTKNRLIFILAAFIVVPLISFGQTAYVRKNISFKVKLITYRLNKYKEISGALIGKAPKKPKQYRLFEKLKSNANESELFELTNHPNPTIRAYAYWGLVDHNSSKVLKVIIKNQNDTVLVNYNYGCTGKHKRLIEFMTECISLYTEKNNIKLSPEELAIVEREKKEWYKREIKPIEDGNEKH